MVIQIVDMFTAMGIVTGALIGLGVVTTFIYRRILNPISLRVVAMSEIIEREMLPNGGASVIDRLTRVEEKIDICNERLTAHIQEIKHTV